MAEEERQEVDLVEPEAPPPIPRSLVDDEATKALAEHNDQLAAASLNAAPAPPLLAPPELPKLPVIRREGYAGGAAMPVNLVELDGHLVEEFTAIDFILMRNSAASHMIFLQIASAYRSMDKQIALWNERHLPPYETGMRRPSKSQITKTQVGLRKGPAAFPGYSNHQAGIALDISTGMLIDDYNNHRYSAIFEWLLAHAPKFGFDNDDVPKTAHEPWHWRHKERRVVGEEHLLPVDHYALLVKDTRTTNAALKLGFLDQATFDEHHGYLRSALAGNASAHDHFAANAENKILLAAYQSQVVAQNQYLHRVYNQNQPEFNLETAKPFVYNFQTGLWGDGKPL